LERVAPIFREPLVGCLGQKGENRVSTKRKRGFLLVREPTGEGFGEGRLPRLASRIITNWGQKKKEKMQTRPKEKNISVLR